MRRETSRSLRAGLAGAAVVLLSALVGPAPAGAATPAVQADGPASTTGAALRGAPAPVPTTHADAEPAADAGDVGWPGPSFAGASGSPSGSKPQSKLWYAHGRWWGALFDATSRQHHIFRLDLPSQRWVDTGTSLDPRPSSRSDVLWDGTHLYVASHVFKDNGSDSGRPSELRRFRYDVAGGRWLLDAGFPVAINDVSSEALVIDKDSTGRLWATWTAGGRVRISHTTTTDAQWAAPFDLPVASAVTTDDISSVVATGDGHIGVMWSDQRADRMVFSRHRDGGPPTSWDPPEIAFSGAGAADDHINIASVRGQGGRVLAVAKTSRSGSAVLVHVLQRSSAGTWTSHPFGIGSDNHTRPVLALDADAARVHVFATSGQSGGSIYEKTAPLSTLAFPTGRGRAVLTDASSADINNASTTKQAVGRSTGLVVVATNDDTREYWTHHDPLGGATPPPPPPPPPPELPGAPTAVTAHPARGQVTVGWGPAPSTTPITAYRVTVVPGGQVREVGAAVREVTITGLDEATPVRFEVRAVTAAGAGPAATSPTVVPGAVLPFPTVAAFTSQQSRDFLGGPASGTLVQVVQAQVGAGATAAEVVAGDLFYDGEAWNGRDRGHGARITRLYLTYFDRSPDTPGLDHWMGALAEGASHVRISDHFARSPEFRSTYGSLGDRDFVALAYRNVLGRDPDDAGWAYWTDRLGDGMSRGRVMVGFADSDELVVATRGTVAVVLLWRAMYGGTPTTADMVREAGQGRSTPTLAAAILDSTRYLDRVGSAAA